MHFSQFWKLHVRGRPWLYENYYALTKLLRLPVFTIQVNFKFLISGMEGASGERLKSICILSWTKICPIRCRKWRTMPLSSFPTTLASWRPSLATLQGHLVPAPKCVYGQRHKLHPLGFAELIRTCTWRRTGTILLAGAVPRPCWVERWASLLLPPSPRSSAWPDPVPRELRGGACWTTWCRLGPRSIGIFILILGGIMCQFVNFSSLTV